LSATQFTGIAVDIILLDSVGNDIDPLLTPHSQPKKKVIINIGTVAYIVTMKKCSSDSGS